MKTSKIVMLLAFIFCVSLSQSATAAISSSDAVLTTTIEKASKKDRQANIKKVLRKQWTKVVKLKKDVKKFLKEKKENGSATKVSLAIAGLICLVLGWILPGIGILTTIGSILIAIAVIWWVLDFLDII